MKGGHRGQGGRRAGRGGRQHSPGPEEANLSVFHLASVRDSTEPLRRHELPLEVGLQRERRVMV